MARPGDLPHGYLGAQPKLAEAGLTTFSHNEPEFAVEENEVNIIMKTTKGPVKVTANLINTTTQNEVPDAIFTQTDGDKVIFVVKFPCVGYFKFQIFALPAADESKTLPGVYNYLINCKRMTKKASQFPKQYAQWKQGCYLKWPLTIDTDDMNNIPFCVSVPNACAVAVTVGDKWTQLENRGGSLWEGSVQGIKGQKLTLNANYGEDKSKYATLLEYPC